MEEMERESRLQERVNILKDQGYRGFQIAGGKGKAEGAVNVSAKNSKGITISAVGDTLDEAYANLIDKIDLTLDA